MPLVTAHHTAAVQVELSRRSSIASPVLVPRLIPTVFGNRTMRASEEHSFEVNATCVHDKLLREADDGVS